MMARPPRVADMDSMEDVLRFVTLKKQEALTNQKHKLKLEAREKKKQQTQNIQSVVKVISAGFRSLYSSY